ncbi:MAG: flagellar motor protein MotB [Actinomycetota bacterium]|nr:flagellar motor protein MotB [Actinomycetota bacterium]
MRRRSAHLDDDEEHVNHEAWVIPYADMLTLLMGLFLVLWAIGNQDLARMKEFAQGFSSQMGLSQPVDGGGGVLADGVAASPTTTTMVLGAGELTEARAALERENLAESARRTELDQLTAAEVVIKERAAQAGFGDAVTFRREDRGLVVSIVSDDVLFAAGAADLRQDGSAALDALAAALVALPNRISIEGHTDDVPISSGRFPSNWELSTSRASVVLRYLVDRHGMDPARLVAGGYAEQRPLETNATPEGRARNRRVDIAVLSATAAAPAGAVSAATDPSSTDPSSTDPSGTSEEARP